MIIRAGLRYLINKSQLLHRFTYLLDKQDKKKFLVFLLMIFSGGLLALLGITIVIPFVRLLIDPNRLASLPLIGQVSYIHAVILLTVLLILVYWLKNFAALLIMKKQVEFLSNIAAKIRYKLFCVYVTQPFQVSSRCSSSELISTINIEVNQFANSIMYPLGNLLNELMTSSIFFIFLLIINPLFSLIVMGGIFLAMRFFFRYIREKNQFYGQQRTQSFTKLAQKVIQALSSLKETKLYQRETFFSDQVKQTSARLASSQAHAQIYQQSPRLLIEVIAITIVMTAVLLLIVQGYSSQEVLVLLTVFGIAAMQLLPSLNRMMLAITNIKYSQPALDKIYQQFVTAHQASGSHATLSPADISPIVFNQTITVNNTSFAYEQKQALHNINLSINKGKKIALVGPSGGGKTTLVDIILGILPPASGELMMDNTVLTLDNLSAWQQHFGYIPQMIYIYECSLRENIAFGCSPEEIDDERVWQALEYAALAEFVRQDCPDGLATFLGENGIRLSGGQRQRVGIARALYRNPDVLVMDEATAALDNETERAVIDAIVNVCADRTLITIAHRLTTIQNYDQIYVIDAGRVVDVGTYDELLRTSTLFKTMVQASQK